MGFCTNCGEALKDKYKFCPKCGGAVEASGEPTSAGGPGAPPDPTSAGGPGAPPDPTSAGGPGAPNPRTDNSLYMVDRKTLFDDGMLVMTSNNLLLYSSDERDELFRIPISKIESCGYSMIKRKLVVKHRTKEDENLERQIVQKERDIHELELELRNIEVKKRKLKSKGKKDLKAKLDELKQKTNKVQQQLATTKKYHHDLKNDPKTITRVKKEAAEIQSTSFRLRDGSRDEYRIWEHVISRRTKGIERIKVETDPYGAVVLINGEPTGTSPLTIDKPIVDKAILSGRYDMTLMLEGHKTVHKHVPVGVGGNSLHECIDLEQLESPDKEADAQVARARAMLAPQTVDLSQLGVLREAECTNEKMVLLTNELLIVSKTTNELYYNIPYGTINSIRYAGGLFGRMGTKRIKIEYSEPDYPDLSTEATLDNRDGKIPEAEVRRRSESLVNLVIEQRSNSKDASKRRMPHPPEHYEITEQDIKTKFARFDPYDFENVIMMLFEKMGYSATVGSGRGDFGADVIAKGRGETIVIQVKKWNNNVGGPDVHKTIGCMPTFSANRAIVVTTSDFTNQAYEIQNQDTPVELWNWDTLCEKVRKHLLKKKG